MTIHHDKMAYGKLASSREDLSEDKIKKMLQSLNGENAETDAENNCGDKKITDGKNSTENSSDERASGSGEQRENISKK